MALERGIGIPGRFPEAQNLRPHPAPAESDPTDPGAPQGSGRAEGPPFALHAAEPQAGREATGAWASPPTEPDLTAVNRGPGRWALATVPKLPGDPNVCTRRESRGSEVLAEKHGLPGEVRLQGASARVLLGTRICVVGPGCENKEK